MTTLRFSKWHGLGNDFILVDAGRQGGFDFAKVARPWCDRRLGIGADGLVVVRPRDDGYEMRIFNADGSECEMCGNATRCVAAALKLRHPEGPGEFRLYTQAGLIRPAVLGNGQVRVDMGPPRLKRGEIPVAGDPESDAMHLEFDLDGVRLAAVGVSMGNPHAVIFVDDIRQVKLEEWGPRLECHPVFPRRANIEFVEVKAPGLIRMRVWERGCGVTAACGTGSCASVVAGVLTGRTADNVGVLLDGGELQVEYVDGSVYMTGPAVRVYQGEIHL